MLVSIKTDIFGTPKAMFKTELDSVNLVIFKNEKQNKIVDMQYYAAGDEIVFEIEIPEGCTADVSLLNGEKKKVLLEIERIEKKLSNEQFVSKAPEKVVTAEREKLKAYQATLENIEKTYLTLFKNS